MTAAYPTGTCLWFEIRRRWNRNLIHIGIDTVDLEGEGFDTNIRKGDKVKQGDVLVVVDLDIVRQAGKSLVSPIAFTGNEKVEVFKIGQNVIAGEKGLLNYE